MPPPAPQIGVSHTTVPDGGARTVMVTLDAGGSVATDQFDVTASKPLDIGGTPSSDTPANDAYASSRENLVEASDDNPPQVGIGDQWGAVGRSISTRRERETA